MPEQSEHPSSGGSSRTGEQEVCSQQHNVSELSALNAFTNTVLSHLSTDRVVSAVYEQIEKTVHPDMAVLYLHDNDNLVLQPFSSKQQGFPEVKKVGECP